MIILLEDRHPGVQPLSGVTTDDNIRVMMTHHSRHITFVSSMLKFGAEVTEAE